MKTRIEHIVDFESIGSDENPIDMNELLGKARNEEFNPSKEDKERVLFLGIDFQKDFMENGALGVPGSHGDIERTCWWIYENMEKITKIAVSIDTHNPFQIFHPCWWVNAKGENPAPFTEITFQDVKDGKWFPVIYAPWSIEYVENLEKRGKKKLMIWTYHCLQGTIGHGLENQFANIIYYQSIAKNSIVLRLEKGQDPRTEMYGILKAEYDPKNKVNIAFLNMIPKHDKIVIAGEAKSHCVLETIGQILDHYKNDVDVTGKIYILEDCMSCIPGTEEMTSEEFERFKRDFKVNIVKSTEFAL